MNIDPKDARACQEIPPAVVTQCNVDDMIYSRRRLPHRELGRLWYRIETSPVSKLPPRLQQTLDLLLSGYREKEIGNALNISTHTAHDFCRLDPGE